MGDSAFIAGKFWTIQVLPGCNLKNHETKVKLLFFISNQGFHTNSISNAT